MAAPHKDMRPETAAIHVPDARHDGAMAPPIHLATTFEHGPAYEPISGHQYSRESNPNTVELEARLTALEGGAWSLAYGSGMAAGAALLDALPLGAVVVFHNSLYHGFRLLAQDLTSKGRIKAVFTDLNDSHALDAALALKPALLWMESPTNPLLEILDIRALAEAAHGAGAKLVVDGTFASPALQQPLALGADYVVHALTKYIGGHSDVMAGALIGKRADEAQIYQRGRTLSGGIISPFTAWMASRGLQTLYCRMEKHCANAAKIAAALGDHANVDVVHYPGLASHEGHDIAKKQMSDFGGMVSIELAGGREAALKMASKVKIFTNATSLGGVESLIEHRASVEGANATSPQSLLRLSVGLEHSDDLIADALQALDSSG
jgi:cystathionine gamma-synthase